jgi:lysozyme
MLAGVLSLASILYLNDRVGWRLEAPSRQRFPARGIDVSHHQGAIDWNEVAASGEVQFAYVKATEGTDFVDPRFETNWTEARAAGLRVGAYHFFTFSAPGRAQAANFLRTVPALADALPPTVDVEYEGNCAAPPDPTEVRRELGAWLSEVESRLGVVPIVYFTRAGYRAHGAAWPRHELWVRSLGAEPAIASWTAWQFTEDARVAGISGKVDMSVLGVTR